MPKYGLATILEDYPIGYDFPDTNRPLHLTHVDSFEVDLDQQELEAKLAQIAMEHDVITIMPTGDTLLGPENDIPVTLLELTPSLARLQIAIVSMLESEGATFKRPEFLKSNYRPHISIYGERCIALDKPVIIKDIAIASKVSDAEDANVAIRAVIPLG